MWNYKRYTKIILGLIIIVNANISFAMAPATRTIVNNPAKTSTPAHFGGTLNPNDTIKFPAVGGMQQLAINTNINNNAINLNGWDAAHATITISTPNAILGSIGNGDAAITVDPGGGITLNGSASVDLAVAADVYAQTITVKDNSTVTLQKNVGGSFPTYYAGFNVLAAAGAANTTFNFDFAGGALFWGQIGTEAAPLTNINMNNDATPYIYGVLSGTNVNLATGNAKLGLWGGTFYGNLYNTSGALNNTGITLHGTSTGTIAGNVGTALNPLNSISFEDGGTIIIDSTTGTRSIYASLLNGGGAAGTVVLRGGNNQVKFYKPIGSNISILSQISVNTNSTAFFDTDVGDVYSPINGEIGVNTGTGNVIASGNSQNLTFRSALGATSKLASVDITAVDSTRNVIFSSTINSSSITTGASGVLFKGAITSDTLTTGAGAVTFKDTVSATNFTIAGPVIFGGAVNFTNMTTGTGAVSFSGAINGGIITAGSGLITFGNSTINGLTASTNNQGSIVFNGSNITLNGNLGDANHKFDSFSMTGADGNSRFTFNNATDIFANNITHNTGIIDVTKNITIHSQNCTLQDTTIDAHDKKITVAGNNVTLIGDIVVNGTYNGLDNQVIMDLSNLTSLNLTGLNSMTFNIDNRSVSPQSNAKLSIIKTPAGIPMNREITLNAIDNMATDKKWVKYDNAGTFIYDPRTIDSGSVSKAPLLLVPGTKLDSNSFSNTNLSSTTISNAIEILSNPDGTNFSKKLEIFVKSSSDSLSAVKLITTKAINTTPKNQVISKQVASGFITVLKAEHNIPPVIADAIQDQAKSGISDRFVSDIVRLAANDPGRITELSNRIISAASNSANMASYNISARMNNTSFLTISPNIPLVSVNAKLPMEQYANEGALGVAAGSSPYDNFGLWGSIKFGKAEQEARNDTSGFKSLSKGATIGVDTMVGEDITIGAALANSINNIKHNDTSFGNRTDTSSWTTALYGNYSLKNNWFIRGTILFDNTSTNNKELRVIPEGYGIAQAKYRMISYGGDVSVGLNHMLSNKIIATPAIGLRILHNNKMSYQEKGDTGQNNYVSQNAMNNYSGLLGLSLAKNYIKKGITFTPEAHVNMQYGINMKTPQGSFVNPLTPNITTEFVGTKPSRITTFYGVSLTGKDDRIECGVSGDISVASKYIGYQTSVRVRVQF